MTAKDFLEGLSYEQGRAARSTQAPVMALAGAGSGKTRMLVGRFLHLVSSKEDGGLGADPGSVMMVTFTNKAAREMRERILPILDDMRERDGAYVSEPWIGTFHGLSLRILRVEASRAGLGNNFSIFDESDARSLLNDVTEEMGLVQFDADEFFRDMDKAKARVLTPSFLRRGAGLIEVGGPRSERWRGVFSHFQSSDFLDVYERYQEALEEQNAVDFSDLLNRVTSLLQSDRKVRDSWRSTFRHFMVDEVQDINRAQVSWLHEMTGGGEPMEARNAQHGNDHADASHGMHEINTYRVRSFPRPTIAFVGDDDQSIYAFRGSDVSVMRGLGNRFPGLETQFMGTSYRCQPSILDCANKLVGHNAGRFGKDLKPHPGAERFGPVRFSRLSSPDEEIRQIAKEAGDYISDGGDANEFAVLVRTRDIAKQVSRELRASGLPVVEGKSSDIRKTLEVKDAMSFVSVLANPDAEVPLRRIVNKPSRGMGLTSMRRVGSNAKLKGVSFLQELKSVMENRVEVPDEGEAYPARFVKAARDFSHVLSEARAAATRAPDAGAGVFEVLRVTGYLPDLYKSALKSAGVSEMEHETRDMSPREFLSFVISRSEEKDNELARQKVIEMNGEDLADKAGQISEVARRIGNISLLISEASGFDTIEAFSQESTLEMSQETAAAGVQVLTVHASKGLEFDHVRLPFWTQGVMPHARAIAEGEEELQEERRLAYVALTRARKTVGVTAPVSVRNCPFIRQNRAPLSEFVSEMSARGSIEWLKKKDRRPALYLQAGDPAETKSDVHKEPDAVAPAPEENGKFVREGPASSGGDPGPCPSELNMVPENAPDEDQDVPCPF